MKYLITLFANLLLLQLSAQTKNNSSEFTWQQFTDGLSHHRITTIIEDHQGFIWIGTYSGLNRFDGLSFEIIENIKDDPFSIPGNRINTLLEDRQNRLWIGTNKGLSFLDRELNRFKRIESTHNSLELSIESVIESSDGNLWAGTNKGIYILNPEQMNLESQQNRLSGVQDVRSLLEDSKGRIWIGTSKELWLYDLETNDLTLVNPEGSKPFEGIVNDMLATQSGQIWISTEGQGLYIIDEKENNSFDFNNIRVGTNTQINLGSNRINALYEDEEGTIWIAPENQGLILLDNNLQVTDKFQSDKFVDTSISSNSIWSIYKDRSGNIWLGTFNKGVNVMNPLNKKFKHVRQAGFQRNGLSHDAVTSFLEVDDQIWIGTDGGGINLWDSQREDFVYYQSNNNPKSISSNAVMDLLQGRDGTIWVATWAGGLNRFDGNGQFTAFKAQPEIQGSIPSNHIFALAEDRNGNLWVSLHDNGIARYNAEDQSFFTINKTEFGDDLWPSDYTNDLVIDKQNDFWVATIEGLNRIEFQSEEDFNVIIYQHQKDDPTSLSNDHITKILEDQSGQIWICTTQGLNLYRPEFDDFLRFDKSDGLPGNFTQSILQDPEQNYWITSNKGVSKLTQKDEGWQFKNYDRTDGVQGDNFIRGASFLTSDQTILLGGTNGFNHFTMEMVNENPNPPLLHFTALRIFNQQIDEYGDDSPLKSHINTVEELVLNHKQNVFSIEYMGVSMTHGDKNTYAFRLEGLETEWNEVGNQRIASYSNLEPGEYSFQVKAANNDGLWTKEHRSIQITVLPPFWETGWFRTLIALVVIGILATIFIFRSRQIKANEQRLRDRVARAVAEANQQKEQIDLEKQKLQNAIAETYQIVNSTLASGSFQERIDTHDKEGEWRELAQSINTLFESILKPFNLLNGVINQVALGDLTPRVEADLKGESELVANNLNLALDNITAYIKGITARIQHIGESSTRMKSATEEMKQVTGEISSAIGEMSSGSKQQLERVDKSFQLTEDIKKFSNEMAFLATSINQSAERGNTKSNQGKDVVGEQNQVMEAIGDLSQKSIDSIQQLEKSSNEISGIIEIIKEIASQTNLLALNAAIEAAQAGDAGRGFAVVAAEIRKLATDSKKSTGLIEHLITSIQSETYATAKLMGQLAQRVKDGLASSTQTREVLEEISILYQETLGSSQKITEATKQQSDNLQGISRVLEEVVVISEQTAAGAEEIHSSAETVNQNMEHFHEQSLSNLEITRLLQEESEKFKVRTGNDPDESVS